MKKAPKKPSKKAPKPEPKSTDGLETLKPVCLSRGMWGINHSVTDLEIGHRFGSKEKALFHALRFEAGLKEANLWETWLEVKDKDSEHLQGETPLVQFYLNWVSTIWDTRKEAAAFAQALAEERAKKAADKAAKLEAQMVATGHLNKKGFPVKGFPDHLIVNKVDKGWAITLRNSGLELLGGIKTKAIAMRLAGEFCKSISKEALDFLLLTYEQIDENQVVDTTLRREIVQEYRDFIDKIPDSDKK